MAIAIFAIVLEMLVAVKKPNPEPKTFVVVSMWLNFVLMIIFTLQTLWPILTLAYELSKEFGTAVLVKLGIWTEFKYLDQVIRTALDPISRIPARLGTRKRKQTERSARIAKRVEMVRKNLMRGVERRRAARREACGEPDLLARHSSVASLFAGAAKDALQSAGNAYV